MVFRLPERTRWSHHGGFHFFLLAASGRLLLWHNTARDVISFVFLFPRPLLVQPARVGDWHLSLPGFAFSSAGWRPLFFCLPYSLVWVTSTWAPLKTTLVTKISCKLGGAERTPMNPSCFPNGCLLGGTVHHVAKT